MRLKVLLVVCIGWRDIAMIYRDHIRYVGRRNKFLQSVGARCGDEGGQDFELKQPTQKKLH